MKTTRFLAVLVAVLMIATAAISVSAFSDVEEGYEHAPAIATLSQLGVINGYADGTFKPENNVERDEMAKLVYVLYTTFQTAGNGTAKFSDLAADNWAAGYVTWCSAKSIIGGYEDGTFRPDNYVTYDEALKMVCATLGYTDFDSALWPTDVRQKALKDLKLGEDIEANGSDKLTRGQVAQLLYNALFVDMNETKVTYVYDTSYSKDPDGTEAAPVKVPVEVAKTLAEDVWNFTQNVVRVVGTENFGYNGAAKSDKEDMIRLEGVTELVKLEDLGLEAYEKNTDALIGLDIMTIEKEGKTVANATVLGSVKAAEVASAGTEDTGLVITDEVKIDGVKYADVKNSETPFADLKTLVYGNGTVTAKDAFVIRTENDGKTSVLEYPHMALVMDNNGDGVVDAIAVAYYTLGEVASVKNVKATTTKPAYVEYTLKDGTKITSDKIADAKTLAKGDVFVYATINGVNYIDAVLEPVTAGVTRINDKEIYLEGVETPVKYVKGGNYLKGVTGAEDFDGAALIGSDKEDQDYFIYNGFVVKYTAPVSTLDSYDLAVFLYAEEATKPVTVDNQVVIQYPVNLLINGKTERVFLSTIGDENGKAFDAMTAAEVCKKADWTLDDHDGDGFVDFANILVNYTVDKNGNYILKSTATNIGTGNEIGDTVVVKGGNITVNTKTGLYTITNGEDGYTFELDEDSVIYYLADQDENNNANTSKKLATYTAANILKNFKLATLADGTYAYLRRIDDSTFVLVAAVISNELEDANGAPSKYTYANDARKILYAPKSADSVSVDGDGYYEHVFMDWATLTNLAPATNAATTITDATKTVAGNFYGWDEDKEVYVKVTTDNTTAIQIGTIDRVDTKRSLIYIDGVKFTENGNDVDLSTGIALGDAKIFATAKANDFTAYATDLDLDKIAEIKANADETEATVNVAVGVYNDENGELVIAWIIVDNYIYSASANGGEGGYIKTADIISSLKAAQ